MTREQVIAGLEAELALTISRSNGELTERIALLRAAIAFIQEVLTPTH